MTESQRYLIPARQHRTEEEIKRSRFITSVAWTPSVDDARDFIRQVSDEFAGANHNCWAYVAGPPGSTAQIGMSDDGEPHGTAGRPMLTVLLHSGIGDVTAVVTRYFGGTLLGKGGLVRAYSGGVKLALESLPTTEKIPLAAALVMVDYASLTPLRNSLAGLRSRGRRRRLRRRRHLARRTPRRGLLCFRERCRRTDQRQRNRGAHRVTSRPHLRAALQIIPPTRVPSMPGPPSPGTPRTGSPAGSNGPSPAA